VRILNDDLKACLVKRQFRSKSCYILAIPCVKSGFWSKWI